MDMLSGSLWDKILIFALPLALSSILQQLFNSVDVAVVGRFAGSEAQAAVGCNGSVINLMLNFFVGISVGANVVIATYIGQHKTNKIKTAVHTAMAVAVISGLFLVALGLSASRPILSFMNTPENVLDKAILYLRIYFTGVPFIMIYNFGASILRSIGDTKRPLYCLIISGIVNLVLNLLLVIVFHMDVAGVAIATVISNLISASMIVYFLSHEKSEVRLYIKQIAVKKDELVKILKIGIPAGFQSMVFSIANIAIQRELNGYGSDAVAGSAVTLNFEYYTFFVISAFSQTTVTFIGQNFGAKKFDRCDKIMKYIFMMCLFGVAAMSIIFIFGRSFFIGLFTNEPKVIEYADIRMVYLLTFYFMIVPYEISGAFMRGIGYSMTPAIITIFGTCILRLTWVYTICQKYMDFKVLMMVYPVSWVITSILLATAFFIIRRKVFAKIA